VAHAEETHKFGRGLELSDTFSSNTQTTPNRARNGQAGYVADFHVTRRILNNILDRRKLLPELYSSRTPSGSHVFLGK